MDLVFIYESNHPIEVKDGLATALETLGREINVTRWNCAPNVQSRDVPNNLDYIQTHIRSNKSIILAWGGFGSKSDRYGRYFKRLYPEIKSGLCLGGNTNQPIVKNSWQEIFNYDVVFYETSWVRNYLNLKYLDCSLVHAFGIDTDVYKDLGTTRDVDYLGVGAYARWKRWEKMLGKNGHRRVIGEYQRNNQDESQEIWDRLEAGGVVCKDMMPADKLVCEYNRAKTVYIPATIMGGGERAVLEARACGCNVEIEPDNPKLKELLDCPIYDVDYYVKQLKRGLCL